MHPEDERILGSSRGRDPHFDRTRLGDRPTLTAFETELRKEMASALRADPSVASVRSKPETFVWLNGADGRRRRHVPAFLVTAVDGAKTYRDIRPLALLVRDPELSGKRARVELECAARGADFEVWTEREIHQGGMERLLARVASANESALYREASRSIDRSADSAPGIVRLVAGRLGLTHLRKVGNVFVARSHLTGIPMAVLCGLSGETGSGLAVWNPSLPVDPGARHG